MKLRKRAYILFAAIILGVVGAVYLVNRPTIEFNHNKEEIEINHTFKAKSFIKKIRGYDIKDVKIDISDVNTKKLGEYVVVYTIHDKQYKLKVEVVDTIPPQFEVKNNITTDISGKLKAKELVTNISDETKTTVSFKENYDLTEEGIHDVTVVVEDEAGNKTEKDTKIQLKKDTQSPILKNVNDFVILKDEKIDYKGDIEAFDDCDPNPQLEINSDKVNTSQIGSYPIIYTVTDRSGNKNTYTKTVTVQKKVIPVDRPQSKEKIVYLTFDDGPSANTKKILKILAKYNAKATFFVTGTHPKYNYVIKEAYNQGHTIGLHTYSHKYNKIYRSQTAYFNDLTKVGNMVKEQIGFVPRYIRFPGGASNTISRKYSRHIMTKLVKEVKKKGYQYYDWNADSTDASGNNVPVSQLVKNATKSHSTNINLLCHDTQAKGTTVKALPKIIEYYQKKGYKFKAIDDYSFTPHQRVNN